MAQKEKQIVLIAGMHRSGTSMLARLLNLHGAYLPLEIEYSNEFNELGYWESFEVQGLNEELLSLGDSSWFDLRAFSVEKQPEGRVEELRQKFSAFISRLTDQDLSTIVIKDPRICRVLPFWRELLSESCAQPLAVIPFRNPLEVASSIKARDGFSTRYCLALWLRNVLEAEVATRGMNRVFCSYSEMLSDWPRVFLKIQDRLQLTDLAPFSEIQQECNEFVTGSLKHWAHSESDLKAYVGPDGLELRALHLLKQAAQDDCQAVQNQFDTLREELNRDSTIEEELEDRDKRIIAFQEVISEALDTKQKELEDLNLQVSAQSSEMNHLRRELSDREATIEALGNTLSWKITAPLRFVVDWLILYPLHLVKRAKASSQKKQKPAIETEPQSGAHTLIKAEAKERRYVARTSDEPPAFPSARLIAFYLPQFHPIPENDKWWGEGFTEWTNVTRAKPLYPLHYQPRIPGDLGYYDLRDVEVLEKQVEMAKQYGLGGFCFYFYWFHGERLLEAPVLNYLENAEFDLPFCLCWANENWTRTWDGKDGQILIGQEHSEEDDLAFIEYISKYLNDARYVRVAGKPLVLVYRPNLLPDAAKTAERWRNWCRDNGVGEIYLAYTQSFEKIDPIEIGFDAAIEFPPNNTGPEKITDQVDDLRFSFKGYVYDWTSVASRSELYLKPDYTLFRGVNPSWDNTARRRETGAVFAGNTPSGYQRWLENAIQDTRKRFDDISERLVFINAWNEWAEGAYLEPDAAYGYAYLKATRNALENSLSGPTQAIKTGRKIILVSHDGLPHGAQFIVLNIARCLTQYFAFHVDMVVLGDGILLDEYKKWATVHSLSGLDHDGPDANALADSLIASRHSAAICNTTVSGLFLKTLAQKGIRCISLVHELGNIISEYKLIPHVNAIAEHAEKVVFPAEQVHEPFSQIAPLSEDKVVIRHQGIYKKNRFIEKKEEARSKLRTELNLPENARIVLGVGYADHRKGVDLFTEAALDLCADNSHIYFVWVGHWEWNMQKQVSEMLEGQECRDQVIFPGRQEITDLFYAGSDVFVLTSREDPFPSTVMEALEVGVPVIGFAGAGGSGNLLKQGCGVLVPYEDVTELVNEITNLLEDTSQADDLGQKGAMLVQEKFSFNQYIFDLLELAGMPQHKVTAIVPNYNYAGYLEQRINSIFNQTYPVFEVIIIDDASTDNSMQVIEKLISASEICCKCVVNERNSGSVFSQWEKGVNLAKGDLIWICEADDYADINMLAGLTPFFKDKQTVLAYCQSKQIDENGKIIANDYLAYTNDVNGKHWQEEFVVNGIDEIKNSMSVKNCIPNVSAVVARKHEFSESLRKCGEQLKKLKITGDWLVYTEIMRHGNIAFQPKALNYHRRHTNSVTIDSSNNEKHYSEIQLIQELIASKYELSVETQTKAKAFSEHARSYLGISSQATEVGNLKPPSESRFKARAIAFYLPQFHPIPENDKWWGAGFTEWTNVSQSKPLYEGHDQPRIPADMGFYDLRLAETRQLQAELARAHGIEGFCYWHYWFEGARLLERPFNEVMTSGKPDFPFCLAWANETWSRRWLGEETDVLISQTYSVQDDKEHIKWLIRAFEDSRYIRIDGRPIFLVYRPLDLPNPQLTTDIFRSACINAGIEEPYLIGVNSHAVGLDSTTLGFDSTLHFMPQLGILPDAFNDEALESRGRRNAAFNVNCEITKIYDYEDSVEKMLSLRDKLGHYTIPSVFVGWDNTPRRNENAIVLANNTPEVFSRALDKMTEELQSTPFEDRLLFINAWNEWAEGNYLEPDQSSGKAYLEAVLAMLKS